MLVFAFEDGYAVAVVLLNILVIALGLQGCDIAVPVVLFDVLQDNQAIRVRIHDRRNLPAVETGQAVGGFSLRPFAAADDIVLAIFSGDSDFAVIEVDIDFIAKNIFQNLFLEQLSGFLFQTARAK